MNDPAIEAAKRGVGQHHWWLTKMDDDLMVSVVEYATDSAREALKPIRELHRRDTIKATSCSEECELHDDMDCPLDVDVSVCRQCYQVAEAIDYYFSERTGWQEHVAWPCATARLVYSEEELP
ncbi:hypothetical protein SAMN04488581_2659 [Mycolicibacterium neoaurum]|uniref:hypothetical protein n=1 Tax=Mycolicibacterium neoaurum TaxID=1795 RepID=UPI00055F41D1|nr:hypothetical protein [Mycolicibacterium neoaurum]SDD61065.1 hypothetical protein SAMN04488581_2659 [Mycolicibacterium neoaurum]